jgi:hypothetical protein
MHCGPTLVRGRVSPFRLMRGGGFVAANHGLRASKRLGGSVTMSLLPNVLNPQVHGMFKRVV